MTVYGVSGGATAISGQVETYYTWRYHNGTGVASLSLNTCTISSGSSHPAAGQSAMPYGSVRIGLRRASDNQQIGVAEWGVGQLGYRSYPGLPANSYAMTFRFTKSGDPYASPNNLLTYVNWSGTLAFVN